MNRCTGPGAWRIRYLSALAAALVLAGTTGSALAQDTPPSANSGPEFGNWGPNQGPPAPEGPSPGAQAPPDQGRLGAPAPGAAAPSAPAPSPNVWGGCNYNLSGGWQYDGHENSPWPFDYRGQAQVTQYGGWLQSTEIQAGSGAATVYYGRCTGNNVRFDVYQGPQFIGYQYGQVAWSPRFGLRVQFNWNTWDPSTGQLSSGTESWR